MNTQLFHNRVKIDALRQNIHQLIMVSIVFHHLIDNIQILFEKTIHCDQHQTGTRHECCMTDTDVCDVKHSYRLKYDRARISNWVLPIKWHPSTINYGTMGNQKG